MIKYDRGAICLIHYKYLYSHSIETWHKNKFAVLYSSKLLCLRHNREKIGSMMDACFA